MSEEAVEECNADIADRTFHASDAEEDVEQSEDSLEPTPKSFRILLLRDAASDEVLLQACQLFNVPVSTAVDFETEHPEDVLSMYVVNAFDGVKKNGQNYNILGRTALLELAQKKRESMEDGAVVLPILERPLYCHALSGQVICFEGYKKSENEDVEKLKSLILLVHHMGGSVRREANCKTTFVIAKLCEGKEYMYAAAFGVSVVSETWVFDAWENRNIVGFNAAELSFVSRYKLKPFFRSRVCFLGFPDEEKYHMIEILRENGGEPAELDDSACTHLVMNASFDAPKLAPVLVAAYPCEVLVRIPSVRCSHYDECACHPCSAPKRLKTGPTAVDWRTSYFRVYRRRSADREASAPLAPSVGAAALDAKSAVAAANGRRFRKSKFAKLRSARPPQSPAAAVAAALLRLAEEKGGAWRRRPEDGLDSALESADLWRLAGEGGGAQNVALCCRSTTSMVVLAARQSGAVDCAGRGSPAFDCRLWLAAWRPAPRVDGDRISLVPQRVVDESKVTTLPSLSSSKVFIVNVEWFWTSVQHEYRQLELDFKIDGIKGLNATTPLHSSSTPASTTSSNRARKRKRLKDKISSLSTDFTPGQSAQKRRSSTSDVARLDVSRLSEGSFLDFTVSPDIVDVADVVVPPQQDKSKNTTRYYKFLELFQTETNYVKILRTIMTLFKEALEKMVDDKNGQLLNATELKIIFGHLPPIYQTHCNMLEEFKQMGSRWNEDCSIGSLILKYSGDLLKAYPPFINFFENTRDMLIKCDRTKPRFHAFLKVCQSKPECGRQSLQDLLIRPVQRLPSINLLLNDILRYTQKTSVDYKALEAAIVSIQDVMAHINEDKRRTEGQVALFDIFNDIENCPAHLVSSQRCFISRCEVTELSDSLSGRGNPLVLFLFSDVIEVCKKKKAYNNLKSPKENSGSMGSKHGHAKAYKHIKLLPLSFIIKVVDIKETEDCHNIFALIVKNCLDLKESKSTVYSFTVTDESMEKSNYLHKICHQIAQVVCRTDTESYLTCLEGEQLDIVTSEVTTGTLGKAFNRFAAKTKIKVGRALSFNKTPSKLKRAVSTMMSPFGNQGALLASTHLANLQLAALPAIPSATRKASTLPPEFSPPSVQS